MNVIKINRLELELDKIADSYVQNAINHLKNGGIVQIVDNVGSIGKIDSPERLEVLEEFNGQLSVEHFKNYIENCKESGRRSFSDFRQ